MNLGADTELSVSASGTSLTYHWFKEGVRLAVPSSNKLPLDNVTENANGGYFVIVSNSLGSVTSRTATVTVIVPPSITQQPLAQTAFQGDNVVFTVGATGTALTYQWKFNGGAIAGATNATLLLPNVQGSAAGKYKVDVENVADRVTSAEVVLSVNVPPVVTTQPADKTINQGQNTTLSVAASGTAPIQYQWFFNGSPLSGATNSSLAVATAQGSQSGNYFAVASNIAGMATSRVASVLVIVPPAITQQPASQVVMPGTIFSLSVAASGTPPFNYQWKLNGGNIASATNAVLNLNNARASQMGTYRVEVSNPAGQVTSSNAVVSLNTNPPPTSDVYWTNALGGAWDDSANWSPNRVPVFPSDNVFITVPGDYSVTLSVPVTNASLQFGASSGVQRLVVAGGILAVNGAATITSSGVIDFTSGAIAGTGTLRLNGVMNWMGGRISKDLLVASNAYLNVSGSVLKQLSGCELTNNGTVAWSGTGNFEWSSGALFVNSNLFELRNDLELKQGAGAQAALINRGTVRKTSGTGVSLIRDIQLVNGGTLEAATGSFTLDSGAAHFLEDGARFAGPGTVLVDGAILTSSGHLIVDTILNFKSGTWNLLNGILSGSGMVLGTGGNVVFDGAVGVTTPFEVRSGTLAGGASGAGALSGQVTWTGGTLLGRLRVANDGTLAITGSQNKKLDGALLENRGTITHSGSGELQYANLAAVNNFGQFRFLSNVALTLAGNSGGAFTNSGVVGFGPVSAQVVAEILYVQTASGVFDVGLGGSVSNSFDQLILNTNAVLDGAVNVWFRNGYFPAAGTQFSVLRYLRKDNCFASLSGANTYLTWACKGRELLLEASLPDFTRDPQSQTINVLSSGSLNVAVTCFTNLQWYFNNSPLTGQTGLTLNLPNIQISQAGNYYAVARNPLGASTSHVAVVEIYSPLTITSPPQSLTVNLGQQATFSVSASSVAPITYQWKFEGGVIPGQTSSSIFLPATTAASAGRYRVIVGNGSETYTSPEVVLTVIVPPAITKQPVGATKKVGEDFRFTVETSGSVPQTFYWFWNGNFFTNTLNNELDLKGLSLSREGVYTVLASNAAGTALSQPATLIVDKDPEIVTQPLPQVVATGSNVLFRVVADGKPAPTYAWKFEGNYIPGATNADLLLPNVQKSQAGRYRVRVTNRYRDVDSTEVRLTVYDAPAISRAPSSMTSVAFSTNNPGANSTASFSVQATGDLLTYQWYRQRQGGGAESIAGATTPTLFLPQVSFTNAGSYWVVISNPVGIVTSPAATLSVMGITSTPTNTTVQPGQTIVLSVAAQGENLRYQWTRNGEFVRGAISSVLTIANAQPQDGGTYAVLVFNEFAAMQSPNAIVRVTSPLLPFANNFEDRGLLIGLSGLGWANNAAASRQADDPTIGGVRYNDSVWVSWTAPSNGIVSMSTLGSDFDTLLAVYRGPKLNELIEVATDDESAGYHNSALLFNVQKGTTYHIRVDSYLENFGGNIVFSWNLLPTDCLLPLNIVPAGDVTKRPDEPFTLCVNFDPYTGPCALNLQWYQDGVAIPGATNRCLSIAAATIDTIGMYSLHMSTRDWEFHVRPSEVQINTEGALAQAHNRLDDARRTPLVGILMGDAGLGGASSFKSLAKVGTPLASGYSGSQIFRTYPGKDPSEPNACGVQGGASYWFTYSPPENGTLRVSTDGSTFDTVLAIFIDDGRNLGYQSLIELGCDNDSGTNGRTSTLTLPVSKGTNYYIMVDGVNGASGRVSLNDLLDSAPKISGIATQMVHENQSTGWTPFTIGDRETAAAQLTVNGICNNAALVATNGFEFSGSGSNRLVRITPLTNCFGTNLVAIRVTDALGGMSSTQFLLCVVRVARNLEITATLEVGIVGTPYAAQLGAVGGAAPYRFALAAAGPGWTLTTNGVLSGTPPAAGTYVFDVRVTDGVGATTNRVLFLNVIEPIRLSAVRDGNGLAFRFAGRPERSYVLETAATIDAQVWTPLTTNSSPTGQLEISVASGANPTAFFRVREQ